MSGPYRHIGARTTDGILVLTIEVEQVKDFTVSEEMRYELVHAVKSRQSKRIILDLRNMTFMTSLACVALIGVRQATVTRGGISPILTSTWQMRHEPTGERPGW